MIKEWISRHRKLWILILISLAFMLGFLQPIILKSNEVFRQGISMGIFYSVIFLLTELTHGGDN